jgi:hypothetical protein
MNAAMAKGERGKCVSHVAIGGGNLELVGTAPGVKRTRCPFSCRSSTVI